MELRVLEYFLAVVREQSISAAAESLHLSQPTLSRQLHQMEEELGKQLFIRGNRKIQLTEEGMILRKRAEEISALVSKTEDEITRNSKIINGNIYVGAGESEGVRYIVHAGKKLQSEYSDVRIHIISGDYFDIADKLEKGILDFAIVWNPTDISSYESIDLPYADTIGVLMRKDCALAEQETVCVSDLHDLPLIVSRHQIDNGSLGSFLSDPIFKHNIIASYNLIYNASLMVEEGIGYAIAFDNIIDTAGNRNLTFRQLTPESRITMHIIWKKNQVFTKAARELLQIIKSSI